MKPAALPGGAPSRDAFPYLLVLQPAVLVLAAEVGPVPASSSAHLKEGEREAEANITWCYNASFLDVHVYEQAPS